MRQKAVSYYVTNEKMMGHFGVRSVPISGQRREDTINIRGKKLYLLNHDRNKCHLPILQQFTL
jgi:hypothetical protein